MWYLFSKQFSEASFKLARIYLAINCTLGMKINSCMRIGEILTDYYCCSRTHRRSSSSASSSDGSHYGAAAAKPAKSTSDTDESPIKEEQGKTT